MWLIGGKSLGTGKSYSGKGYFCNNWYKNNTGIKTCQELETRHWNNVRAWRSLCFPSSPGRSGTGSFDGDMEAQPDSRMSPS